MNSEVTVTVSVEERSSDLESIAQNVYDQIFDNWESVLLRLRGLRVVRAVDAGHC
jgi:hypothetical protein